MTLQAPAADRTLPSLARIDWGNVFRSEKVVPALLEVVIVLAVAFLGYHAIKLLTRRMLAREIEEDDPLVRRTREQRVRTLASLLNSVALVVILVLAGLTILSTFIDIAPLLAGAGIAGLAISFGAQSLVKDVINGIFIILEGQFGIGDVVRIGDTSGMVERISLRTTMLRDLEGVVHIIPNGEITRVSNLTKTWSRAVLDVGVSYHEDIDRVIELLRRIGRDFAADPDWGPLLLEPPEVLGVQELASSAILVRLVAKTLPLKQWDVARELRRRIKNGFAAEGVEIPFPQVTVHWGGEGAAPANAALLGGASHAAAEAPRTSGAPAARGGRPR